MAPASTASKRLMKELKDISKDELPNLKISSEKNIYEWTCFMEGSGVYEGIFELKVIIPTSYPFHAPKVSFVTKIYHCNVSHDGAICIDILKGNWSPALSIIKVLLSISSLLDDPNPKDPLVPSIADQYLNNRALHDRTASDWTKKYAKPIESTKRARSDSVEIQESNKKFIPVIVID